MSIRLRLALLFTAAASILLVAGGALFITQLQASLEQNLTLTLSTRAANIATELAGSGSMTSTLRRRGLLSSANGIYTQVLTPGGRPIASSRLVTDEPLLSPAQTRAAQRHTLVVDKTITLSGLTDAGPEAMRVLARTVGPSGDVLVVALSRDVTNAAISGVRNQLVLLGLTALLLAGPGSWLLTGAALRPVERMRIEVRDLNARNAGAGLRVPRTRDEIARLADTFNSLLGRLHAALLRERMLVADAGHELRTPLTVLKGELELARRPNRSREELVNAVGVAAAETDRLVGLTEDLLFLSSEAVEQQQTAELDVVAVASKAIEAMSGRARARGVCFKIDAPASVRCTGNPDWIRRAIENVLANAVRHAPTGSSVTVRIAAHGESIQVAVTDEGSGFPPGFLPLAFDRFARADDSRLRTADDAAEVAGSGLGLAIVRSIMGRHGGTATAANRPEKGAEVTLTWPRWKAPQS